MANVCVPIIVIMCYLIGEIYKVILKNNKKYYKLIPLLVPLIGGILGILIYLTDRKMIFNINSIWDALYIGIVSGAGATCTNQIVKQIFKKEKK